MDKQLYEAMFIIHPGNDEEEARNKVIEQIQTEIKKQKGQVVSIHPLGRRELAYPIKRMRDGYYYLIHFELNTQSVQKIRDRFKITAGILRELILKIDKMPEKLDSLSESLSSGAQLTPPDAETSEEEMEPASSTSEPWEENQGETVSDTPEE